MSRAMVGASVWDDLSAKERQAAIDARVYESAGYDAWMQQREGGGQQVSKRQQKLLKKRERLGGPVEMDMPRDLTE